MYLICPTEEGLASVHLHQDAAQRPHVYGQVIGHAQKHLGGAVESALDVLVNLRNELSHRINLSAVNNISICKASVLTD